MIQISKIHFTPEGEISNYFNFLKKLEIRTERSTKQKSTNEWVLRFIDYFLTKYYNL